MEKTSVAIVDDQTRVRQAIRAMLESQPDISVVGEAASGLEALALVDEIRPQVLVLDLVLGDVSGFEVTSRINENSSPAKVIIFSIHWGRKYVLRAKEVGASGYVPKQRPHELVKAIYDVSTGGVYFSDHG
jgi:DNA-binding NarL/FixJ family response regulator